MQMKWLVTYFNSNAVPKYETETIEAFNAFDAANKIAHRADDVIKLELLPENFDSKE